MTYRRNRKLTSISAEPGPKGGDPAALILLKNETSYMLKLLQDFRRVASKRNGMPIKIVGRKGKHFIRRRGRAS